MILYGAAVKNKKYMSGWREAFNVDTTSAKGTLVYFFIAFFWKSRLTYNTKIIKTSAREQSPHLYYKRTIKKKR